MSNKTSLFSKRVAEDPAAQGMKARVQHKRRDACPYALSSEERHGWLEGYDGVSSDDGPLVPARS